MELDARNSKRRTSARQRKNSKEISGQIPLPGKTFKTLDDKYMYFKRMIIGSGSFGKVYYGMNMNRTIELACKFEKTTVKRTVLGMETSMYKRVEGGVGIPTIHYFGEIKNYKIMVMDLLGPSIDKYFKICNRRFSLKTSLMLGAQMFKRIEHVHNNHIVHRDIKPNNFLLGRFTPDFSDNTIYIIDFGLSKYYIEDGAHVPFKDDAKFVGTPRYASLNAHIGNRQSRRDDLESIFYLLVYFVKGDLPWQGIRGKTKSEKKEKIKMKKKETSPRELCYGLPGEFYEIFVYIRNLKYDEKPNYDLIVNLLNSIAVKNNIIFNYDWDWNQVFKQSGDKNINVKKEFTKLYKGYPNANFTNYLKSLDQLPKTDLNFVNVEILQSTEPNSNGALGRSQCEDINFLFSKLPSYENGNSVIKEDEGLFNNNFTSLK